MEKQEIIIVGGGICGLYAASLLSEQYNVILLEGSGRLGGRILDVADPAFIGIVKRGAEFIHGEAQLTFALLKQAGVEYNEVDGKMYSMNAGKVEETNVFVAGWDELMKKMKAVSIDISLYEFLEFHFKSDRYAELKRQAMRYAEGYDIADPDKVSVMALYKEWSTEEVTYQLNKGYGPLIDYLANKCSVGNVKIYTDAVVKEIEWRKGHVEVYTENGKAFNASKVLVTVPLGVLQKQGQKPSIVFQPTLNTHIAAAQKIGFGAVVKACLELKGHFGIRIQLSYLATSYFKPGGPKCLMKVICLQAGLVAVKPGSYHYLLKKS